MKLSIVLIAFVLISCQNSNQKREETSSNEQPLDTAQTTEKVIAKTDTVESAIEVEIDSSDLTPEPLGLSTLRNFELNGNQRSKKMNDSLFIEFLKAFTIYQNSANDLLFDHPMYDTWNTLAYSPDNKVAPEATVFEDSVKEIGFMVAMTEGSIYLGKDPQFLSRFRPYLSERMKDFLIEYQEDISNPFMDDGSIVIPITELIRRMMFWEDFSKYEDFELPDYAIGEFEKYLVNLMLGTGNTPIHDWSDSLKVRPEMIKTYKTVIDQYPDSKASEYLKDYLIYLEQKKYRYDNSFHKYGREKFPSMYGN